MSSCLSFGFFFCPSSISTLFSALRFLLAIVFLSCK